MSENNIIAVRATKKIYREGERTYKVFDDNYSISDIYNEAYNLANVDETDLKVPALEEVVKIDGQWAIVTKYIEGKTLAQLMEENPDKIDEYLDRFVDIQLYMHSHSCPRLSRLTEKMHRKIRISGLDATTRYELHTRLDSIEEHTKLCHGDFNPTNIIITDNDEAYILDWSHATQGNASADAARTYLLFNLANNEDLAQKYMKLFCAKSDTARQYVDKWVSIVSASQLSKGNSEEREFLMQWASVVDYS